ncbi:MAG TPA: type I methionyl aminopeptidase [Candidatus Dormibacteraeota bacterium]|nr:type I methionyl aminopeptidase [Candidatus Dormibacteraeota bacterium]
MVTRKSRREIEAMRRAGHLVAEVLALVESALRPGITARSLDDLAERHIRDAGGTPSFKGYRPDRSTPPFPGSICVSIDDEVVHGLPDDRTIRPGQLVSVDAGAIVDGWHGDAARTFFVGEPPVEIAALIESTRLALMAGIAAAVPGSRIGDISAAIEDIALAGGYGIVEECVGHGIGTAMHEPPDVPNYRTRSKGLRLEPGLCLAIEPMLTLGSPRVGILDDGWTIVTRDGSPAAHFEHTIAITEQGPEILTSV